LAAALEGVCQRDLSFQRIDAARLRQNSNSARTVWADRPPRPGPSAARPADPEPIPQGGGFLCTFTLSRPGLVGLNKLAIYLNNLQDSGSIGGWQANGWEDAATKVRALIRFVNHADAIIAIKGVH
jgi:hypothetical protein